MSRFLRNINIHRSRGSMRYGYKSFMIVDMVEQLMLGHPTAQAVIQITEQARQECLSHFKIIRRLRTILKKVTNRPGTPIHLEVFGLISSTLGENADET